MSIFSPNFKIIDRLFDINEQIAHVKPIVHMLRVCPFNLLHDLSDILDNSLSCQLFFVVVYEKIC